MTREHAQLMARVGTAIYSEGDLPQSDRDAVYNEVEALITEVESLRAEHHIDTAAPGLMPNGDNYTRLARCMGCEPDDVSRLVQQHAPWNGKPMCDDAQKERAAVVAMLRACADAAGDAPMVATNFRFAANIIERGEHRRAEKP